MKEMQRWMAVRAAACARRSGLLSRLLLASAVNASEASPSSYQ